MFSIFFCKLAVSHRVFIFVLYSEQRRQSGTERLECFLTALLIAAGSSEILKKMPLLSSTESGEMESRAEDSQMSKSDHTKQGHNQFPHM